MRFALTALVVASSAMVAVADIDFDWDDVPQVCRSTCEPVRDLSRTCEVDLPGDDNDNQETQLEVQCFCTNTSFDVASVAALCQACIRQEHNPADNNDDDDDDDNDDDDDDHNDSLDDINNIIRTCGFSTTSWASTAAPSSVTVSATRPTDIAQLTTTFEPSTVSSPTGGPTQTNDDANDDNNNDDDDNMGGHLMVPEHLAAALFAVAGLMAIA